MYTYRNESEEIVVKNCPKTKVSCDYDARPTKESREAH